MAQKKSIYRFTIGFNSGDPAHQQVAELLNQQGRRKAQFLVNAVLHYIHCPETPDLSLVDGQAGRINQADMEALIMRILEERGYVNTVKGQPDRKAAHDIPEPAFDRTLDAAGYEAIADSLTAFRNA